MASEFWRYFRETLRWPLIHAPGPLAALVKGLAASLDETRDDILYFRRQWLPAHCEDALIPGYGTSRGLVRHPKESAGQFRARVVNAWRWHLLGGKVQGLPEILKFYGFDVPIIQSLRPFQPSRWAEFQLGLKTPVTQVEQQALLEGLDTLIWLVNEYKPARSVLARVYTDTYNANPTGWSGLPVSDQGWSQGFWSRFSGVDYAGNGDNPGVIVSFGMALRAQAEPYATGGVGMGVESVLGILAPYIDRPVWSQSYWGEQFPRNHAFVVSELISFHACVRVSTSWPWRGKWDKRQWQRSATWDRLLPKWFMRRREWAKSEAVYSWASDGKEPGEPLAVGADGTWGDCNACYGRPRATIFTGARWGDPWGKDPGRREMEILERFRHWLRMGMTPVNPGPPACGSVALLSCAARPLRRRGWKGKWNDRRWNGGMFGIKIQEGTL